MRRGWHGERASEKPQGKTESRILVRAIAKGKPGKLDDLSVGVGCRRTEANGQAGVMARVTCSPGSYPR